MNTLSLSSYINKTIAIYGIGSETEKFLNMEYAQELFAL